jgi:nitrogen fixation/metabolism regulation signal transduction histidine kinase
MLNPGHSLEQTLVKLTCYFALSSLFLTALAVIISPLSLNLAVLWLVVWFSFGLFFWRMCHRKVLKPLYLLTSQVDAIKQEEYRVRAPKLYRKGIFASLQGELNALGAELQQRKSRYDQHLFLLHRLIENIETPVLILDKHCNLTHANAAFAMVYNCPWESLRQSHASLLGLQYNIGHWTFMDRQRQERWQIRSSEIQEHNVTYQMLIFTDVQSILRETQKRSWQQVIRVMNHEIRNSLSPIRSLAQTLKNQTGLALKTQNALDVIVERSMYLQDFVTNYSRVFQPISITKQQIKAETILKKVQHLFAEDTISCSGGAVVIYADPVLLEQVLINLVLNATEASKAKKEIKLLVTQTVYGSDIYVQDQGQGIANPDNIFVPFYSTKPDGQGIGLGLSRQIIEAHHGRLVVRNRLDCQGAEAIISLPTD